MEADPTFHVYCKNNGRVGGRNEYTLRKLQVTLDRLAMVFKVNFFIYQYRVRNKTSQFANCESFLENCELKSAFCLKIANQHFLTIKQFYPSNYFTCLVQFFSFQWNIALISFKMRTYISEIGNNFSTEGMQRHQRPPT